MRERTFGLVRADGSEKPAAAAFRNFRKLRAAGGGEASAFAAIPRVLDMSAEDYYRAPGANFERLYAAWLARAPS